MRSLVCYERLKNLHNQDTKMNPDKIIGVLTSDLAGLLSNYTDITPNDIEIVFEKDKLGNGYKIYIVGKFLHIKSLQII